MPVGGSGNTHWYNYFRTKRDRAWARRLPARLRAKTLGEGRRIVQKAHEMDHRHIRTGAPEPGRELQDASRIRAHDEVRTGLEDASDLVPLQLHRDVRVREVVDPGTSAAAVGGADLHDLDARHRAQ